jgi:regulator of sigma E protease
MLGIVAGILLLGILVFIHELGHFCVAKLAGVKVLKFSLGFGPRLISRKWGETEYMISAVPLGGYVQMLGEGGGSEEEEALSEKELERSFARKSVSRRLAIVAAGPFMNLALPFLVLPLAYLIGVNLPSYLDQPPCVGYVLPESPAAAAGLERGDCIEGIGALPVSSWTEADKVLLEQAGQPPVLAVRRGHEIIRMTPSDGEAAAEGLQALGLFPEQAAVVGSIGAGMPAQRAGMQKGDRIVAIGSEPVDSWYDLRSIIEKGEGKPQVYHLLRDGQEMELEIASTEADGNGETRLVIGISPLVETSFKRFGPVEALRFGSARALELMKLTLVFIQKLVLGHVSTRNVGGPITVVQVAGQAAQTDFSSILSMLAFLSVQLGILNLFPIPILDGGHLLFNLFELVFRRPLSLRVREVAQQLGLVLILMLMALAFYNDLMRIFLGGQ